MTGNLCVGAYLASQEIFPIADFCYTVSPIGRVTSPPSTVRINCCRTLKSPDSGHLLVYPKSADFGYQ